MKKIPALSPRYAKLPNGLSLSLYGGFPESESQAMITFLASCGLFTEDKNISGITHALEHMLFKGTGKYSNFELTSKINSLGGSVDAYTTADSLCLELQIAPGDIDAALDVLSEMVISPSFPAEEIELEKKVILEEISYYDDDPEDFVTLSLEKLCFGGTCYEMPILGNEKTVSSFTRKNFVDYHKRCFSPNNCSLTIAGSFDSEGVEKKINEYLGPVRWAPGSISAKNFDFMRSRPRSVSASFIRKNKYSQDYAGFSFRLPARIDGRFASSLLLPYIFTILRSAPLGFALREGSDAVNSVTSDLIYKYGAWMFVVAAALEPEKRVLVKKAIRNFISSIAGFVTADHFSAAKNLLLLDYFGEIENPRSYCSELSTFNYLLGKGSHQASVENCLSLGFDEFRRYLTDCVQRAPLQSVELVSGAPKKGKNGAGIVFPSCSLPAQEFREENFSFDPASVPSRKGVPELAESSVAGSGIRIASAIDRALTHSTLSVYIAGGVSISRIPGEAHVFSELLSKAAGGRAMYESFLVCDRLGIVMDCASMMDYIQIEASCPGSWTKERLEFISNVLKDFGYTSGLLSIARKGVRRSAKNLMDDVFDFSFWSFARMLFAAHPYSRFILGNESRLSHIGGGQIDDYYSRLRRAGKMVISYSSPGRVDDLFYDSFSGFYGPGVGRAAKKWPVVPSIVACQRPPRDREIKTPHTQCTFVAGGIAPAAMTEDSLAFSVANHILTDYSGKRLWDLRESQGLCYNIFSEYIPLAGTGIFLCYANFEGGKLVDVRDGVAAQFEKFCAEGPGEKEIDDARAQILKKYELALASCATSAKSAGHSLFYGRGVEEFLRFRERLDAISRETVMRAARKYLAPENISRLTLIPSR